MTHSEGNSRFTVFTAALEQGMKDGKISPDLKIITAAAKYNPIKRPNTEPLKT